MVKHFILYVCSACVCAKFETQVEIDLVHQGCSVCMQLTSPITSSKLIFAIFAESQAHKLAILGPGKVVLAVGVILICTLK